MRLRCIEIVGETRIIDVESELMTSKTVVSNVIFGVLMLYWHFALNVISGTDVWEMGS